MRISCVLIEPIISKNTGITGFNNFLHMKLSINFIHMKLLEAAKFPLKKIYNNYFTHTLCVNSSKLYYYGKIFEVQS